MIGDYAQYADVTCSMQGTYMRTMCTVMVRDYLTVMLVKGRQARPPSGYADHNCVTLPPRRSRPRSASRDFEETAAWDVKSKSTCSIR